MRKIFMLVVILFLGGCSLNNPNPKTHYIESKCPTFNSKLSISIEKYNDKYGAISWVDVAKIEDFLNKKKLYNKKVKELNKEK